MLQIDIRQIAVSDHRDEIAQIPRVRAHRRRGQPPYVRELARVGVGCFGESHQTSIPRLEGARRAAHRSAWLAPRFAWHRSSPQSRGSRLRPASPSVAAALDTSIQFE